MKVGSTVYVTNTVLHDLIYAEDFWDRFVDNGAYRTRGSSDSLACLREA